jgi:hypothetical protein
VNVTDVEVTAAGDIFFTVQWTQPDPDGVFTSPGFDRQYIQALYRYAAQSKTLETLTNPKLFGDGSIPVQDIRVFFT